MCGGPGSQSSTPRPVEKSAPAAAKAATASGSATPRRARQAPPLARVSMRGVVVDREGAPVADAIVVLAMPPRTVRTTQDGRFEVPDLLPGHYNVEARRGGQIAGPLGVNLHANTGDITLRMYRGFVLEVEVVAADTSRAI